MHHVVRDSDQRRPALSMGLVATVMLLASAASTCLNAQDRAQANKIASTDGGFSFVPPQGWDRHDPNSRGGVTPGLAKAVEMEKNLDVILDGPQSSWGVNRSDGQMVIGPATLNVTHFVIGRDAPKGLTPDKYRADLIASETEDGIWSEFRPEAAARITIDGHTGIAWLVTKGANGFTIKTYQAAVIIGSRLYDFHFQAGGVNDFTPIVQDANRLLGSVRFR